MVRAKFNVISKEQSGTKECITHKVVLRPVFGNNEENKAFWKYTPTGVIELQTINQNAADQFEVGKEYYVDFTPAEQE
jgi:hypothetical protein